MEWFYIAINVIIICFGISTIISQKKMIKNIENRKAILEAMARDIKGECSNTWPNTEK
jgi:hypothetical protein